MCSNSNIIINNELIIKYFIMQEKQRKNYNLMINDIFICHLIVNYLYKCGLGSNLGNSKERAIIKNYIDSALGKNWKNIGFKVCWINLLDYSQRSNWKLLYIFCVFIFYLFFWPYSI